jgi:hypothetical protein
VPDREADHDANRGAESPCWTAQQRSNASLPIKNVVDYEIKKEYKDHAAAHGTN